MMMGCSVQYRTVLCSNFVMPQKMEQSELQIERTLVHTIIFASFCISCNCKTKKTILPSFLSQLASQFLPMGCVLLASSTSELSMVRCQFHLSAACLALDGDQGSFVQLSTSCFWARIDFGKGKERTEDAPRETRRRKKQKKAARKGKNKMPWQIINKVTFLRRSLLYLAQVLPQKDTGSKIRPGQSFLISRDIFVVRVAP